MLTAEQYEERAVQLSVMESEEEVDERSIGSTDGAPAAKASSGRSRRRRLSPEQQREVARLYAEASMPTSQIRDRFGIGESSLYRIVQRQGIPLRGRGQPASPQPQPADGSDGQRRGPTSRSVGKQRVVGSQPRAAGARTGRGTTGRAAGAAVTTGPARPIPPRSQSPQRRFRIRFAGERVVEALDLRSALRQVEALDGTKITSVTREG
jgi:transposase-like protein